MKKMFRKVLSILLIMFLLTPSIVSFASYGEDSIKLIEELGIAKESKFAYFQKNYTRADFAYILCQIDSSYKQGMSDASVVSDVAEDNIDVCAHVVTKGYLRLDEKGNFNPDDYVTYNDTVIALVTLLGYDTVAELSGGKLVNYISTARKIKLTSGISATNDKFISKQDLASMVVNAMEITPATMDYEDGAYIELPTILEHNDMYVEEGVLLATEKRGIGADVCDAGYINLGGKLYKTEKVFDTSYVGREVYAYIKEGQINDTVVALVNMGGESIVIEPNDITYSNVGRSYTDIKYGNKQKVRIPHNATVMVNGKPGDLTNQLFSVFNSGTLELIDSDNNGDFDTVDMTICVTEVVESASVASNAINTKYTKRYIDLDANNNAFTVYEGGEVADMSAIRTDSVVSIACDKFSVVSGVLTFDYANAEFVKVYVSNRKVTGLLEYTTDEGEYGVDGRNFNSLPILATIENSGAKSKILTGNSYTFYLDYFGNICDYKLNGTENAMQYGYLMLADDDTAGFDTTAKMKVLTTSNDLEIYEINKKYIVDGVKLELGVDAFPTALSSRQLIRYKVADGKVVEIDTAIVNSAGNEVSATSLSIDSPKGVHNYIPNQGSINYMYAVTSKTTIFLVSQDPTADESNYAIGNVDNLGSINDANQMEIFDVDETGETACILLYKAVSTAVARQNQTYMVENIKKALDDKGDEVYRLHLHGYAGSVNLNTVEISGLSVTDISGAATPITKDTLTSVAKGDLIRYTQNSVSKKIERIERVFCLATDSGTFIKPENVRANQPSAAHYGYGQVYQANDTHLVFTAKEDLTTITPSDKLIFAFKYASRIPVYNMKDGTITLVGADYKANIPTYLNTAETVTAFIHMNIYEVPSIAIYVWN